MDARISKYKIHAINIKILIAVMLIFWLRSKSSANSLLKSIVFWVDFPLLEAAFVPSEAGLSDCLVDASVLMDACAESLCVSELPFDGMEGACLL